MGETYQVYYNLKNSPLTFSTESFKFHFSSIKKLDMFTERQKNFRRKVKQKFESLYGVQVNFDNYADIILYSQVEKRGFYIVRGDGEVYEWLSNLILDGEIKTLKHLNDM